jgi:hypothetical protein
MTRNSHCHQSLHTTQQTKRAARLRPNLPGEENPLEKRHNGGQAVDNLVGKKGKKKSIVQALFVLRENSIRTKYGS